MGPQVEETKRALAAIGGRGGSAAVDSSHGGGQVVARSRVPHALQPHSAPGSEVTFAYWQGSQIMPHWLSDVAASDDPSTPFVGSSLQWSRDSAEVSSAKKQWEVGVDQGGYRYFFCSATHETAWELPPGATLLETADAGRGVGRLASPGYRGEGGSGGGRAARRESPQWEAVVDGGSGSTYYYCAATNESVWELPPGARLRRSR